ncbi:MAG: hypothetical protein DRP63_09460 [Planctomycetota bacterium]|nr:MAG: hypothetical protein DRP63_09460 [Planctomycetota bacterium]
MSGTPPTGSAGSYPFTVSVTDGQQTASKQFDLLVQSGGSGTSLKADFEASPTQGTAPLTVNFTDKSTGSPTSWEWDFDNDGTVDSTQQNPTHTYNDPGWYTVKLTVSDGTSSDICVKEKYVLVASGIYCVDGVGGNDANSGLDWSNAWKTIGKALSVAGDYDLVLVADATYNETDLNFNGKKIYLKGVDHNNAGQQPVIDCQQAGRAFYFGSGETGDCVIDNFTIQNGKVSGTSGGAVLCESNSSPTIKNCVFKDNETESGMWTASGGAIACWDSSDATISGCTFIGNRTVWYGGAIFWHSSDPTVTNCIFKFNNAFHGAAIGCWESTASIINCIFDSNGATNCGGAITCSSSSPTLTNCTFSGNGATNFYGGAISCNFSSPTLNNCILWDDIAGSSGNEIYIKDPGSSCTLNYCCVDNTGYGGQTGNITENNCIHVDPQFVDVLTGDYHLKDTSPCIDAGDNSLVPSSVTTDLDGRKRIVDGDNDGSATVDIGAYEYQP